ncbi:MAG: FAD-dependent thymidylate synthase [Candidatus Izemoplasmatales bacterium]
MEDQESKVTLLRYTPDPEELIEIAGKECHLSDLNEEKRGDFIKRLVRMEHFSVLEHASATFHLKGMSRACSHQLVRHRIASYSQRSQRYTRLVKAEDFVMPSGIKDPVLKSKVDQFYGNALGTYEALLDLGVKPEDARYVLPAGTTTSIVMTMNFSSLRHFFKLRIHPKAQAEIRQYAWKMLQKALEIAPNVFDDVHSNIMELVKEGRLREGE